MGTPLGSYYLNCGPPLAPAIPFPVRVPSSPGLISQTLTPGYVIPENTALYISGSGAAFVSGYEVP